MTSPASATPADYATPAAGRRALTEEQLTWRWFYGLAAVLGVVYLLLQNPYWVPGGDSDFYVAIARNLALEGKYEFNGLPVAISPPGWPWLMAAVLKVSPTFLALKLATMLCMWGSLLIGYFIAIRFVPPRIAALSIGLAGILMPVYSLTYFLHSEALYCLLSAWALLICLRLREGTGHVIEAVALVGLCVAIPVVRWAGVFQLLPIVAVLLSGKMSPTWGGRRWALAIACAAAIVATWMGTRHALELSAEQALQIAQMGGGADMEVEVPAEVPTDAKFDTPVATGAPATVFEEYSARFIRAGKWFSWLLWHPTRFAGPLNKWLDSGVSLLGWFVIGILAFVAIRRAIKGEFLWLALGIYCGGLCMNWPNPNARYFVPVAPLIVLGVLLAIRDASSIWPSTAFDWGKWLRRAFVYTVLLANVALYAVDVMIMRSGPTFYENFEAGQHRDLVNIAHYLMSLPPAPTTAPATTSAATAPAATTPATTSVAIERYAPRDGEVMINERYENLGRVRFSKAGMRAMVLLTDRNTKPLDKGLSKFTVPLDPATSENAKRFPTRMIRAVRRSKVDWVLIQSPTVPWRVWHLRIPQEWDAWLSKRPDRAPSGGWTLYHYDYVQGDLVPEPVPPVDGWPTRVPGM